ncbi:CMP-N-acetylneuraminic acid synthetase [Flavobacterium cyanobacteriorum]|uniref:CMP-N-acetylneuraminic acid synthetase n=1 Tax=Flavobacterium cyanobacteriorum TaxID=2022802 RepID=A0A255YSD5_9FLAO|nr:acylneuraminate cytidylyltransferase family protein [Flavobacterium cyanobacteriorum]OYQ32107.1 CMP-N-acetylneuraminic acid synthetase [Flavobacterium cyanobacteriorum]
MEKLVVIPARGGSKGVPQKNIKLLHGIPLIHYTVNEARKVFDDSRIIVSTDDEVIKDTTERTGLKVPFLRPQELATDTAGTYEVLLHALNYFESTGKRADVLILLQPTSPFRKARHIEEALQLYTAETDMVVSVKETKANPYYLLFEENKEGYLQKSKPGHYIRRQDCPQVWEYNGAVYIINVESLKSKPIADFTRVRKYVMDEFSSHDIDTPYDWLVAESIAQLQNING